jgi:hypothetical protein
MDACLVGFEGVLDLAPVVIDAAHQSVLGLSELAARLAPAEGTATWMDLFFSSVIGFRRGRT